MRARAIAVLTPFVCQNISDQKLRTLGKWKQPKAETTGILPFVAVQQKIAGLQQGLASYRN
jgi:hypothetical protein